MYEVDKGFLESIVLDPGPLYSCDDATLDYSGGLFEVSGAGSGEFLYELGLRNDDRMVSVNGMGLTSYYEAILAFNSLYLGGETEFELLFVRSGVTNSRDYKIVD